MGLLNNLQILYDAYTTFYSSQIIICSILIYNIGSIYYFCLLLTILATHLISMIFVTRYFLKIFKAKTKNRKYYLKFLFVPLIPMLYFFLFFIFSPLFYCDFSKIFANLDTIFYYFFPAYLGFGYFIIFFYITKCKKNLQIFLLLFILIIITISPFFFPQLIGSTNQNKYLANIFFLIYLILTTSQCGYLFANLKLIESFIFLLLLLLQYLPIVYKNIYGSSLLERKI